MNTPALVLGRIPSRPEGNLTSARSCFEAFPPLSLGQTWESRPHRNFQPGTVSAAWCPDHLHVFGSFEDTGIVVSNMKGASGLLSISDVFQIFVERVDHGDYLEVHVTPDNRLMLISWTPERLEQFQDGHLSINDVLLEEGGRVVSRTWIEEDASFWHAYVSIPVSILCGESARFDSGHTLRGTFCRFDASPESPEPILSSTSSFSGGPRFHDCHCWHEFCLSKE